MAVTFGHNTFMLGRVGSGKTFVLRKVLQDKCCNLNTYSFIRIYTYDLHLGTLECINLRQLDFG